MQHIPVTPCTTVRREGGWGDFKAPEAGLSAGATVRGSAFFARTGTGSTSRCYVPGLCCARFACFFTRVIYTTNSPVPSGRRNYRSDLGRGSVGSARVRSSVAKGITQGADEYTGEANGFHRHNVARVGPCRRHCRCRRWSAVFFFPVSSASHTHGDAPCFLQCTW